MVSGRHVTGPGGCHSRAALKGSPAAFPHAHPPVGMGKVRVNHRRAKGVLGLGGSPSPAFRGAGALSSAWHWQRTLLVTAQRPGLRPPCFVPLRWGEERTKLCRMKPPRLASSNCSNRTGPALPQCSGISCASPPQLGCHRIPGPNTSASGRVETQLVPQPRVTASPFRQVPSPGTGQAALPAPRQASPSAPGGLATSHTHPGALQPLPHSPWAPQWEAVEQD